MSKLNEKLTFKNICIIVLVVVFIYLLFKNKNENLENSCINEYQKCKKVGDSDNCCKDLVCYQNQCVQPSKTPKKTKLSQEDVVNIENRLKSEIKNRGYNRTPKVKSKIDSESEIDSELGLESELDLELESESKIDSELESESKIDTNDSRSNVPATQQRNIPVIDTKKSFKRMGDSCIENNECLSGKCSKEYNTCVFNLDGENCSVGSQCVSQKCDPKTKKCVKKDMGEKCIFGSQCMSGSCSSKSNCNRDISGDCDAICLN